MKELKEIVFNTLQNVGIMVTPSEDDFNLREYIQDSLQYISFIVELEQVLDIEIPDELLLFDSLTSFNGFCQMIDNVLGDSSEL